MKKLAPSILSADFANLERDISRAVEGGADYLHIDVMDGHFVPNITIGPVVVKSIKKAVSIPLDVHLMISAPSKYYMEFIDAGADFITFHIETEISKNPRDLIMAIRDSGVKPAVSIKPATPVNAVKPFLSIIDMVLVMTVEPGFGGQGFIPETLPKIAAMRELIDRTNPACELQIDGGVNKDNIAELSRAGVDVFVAGSAVFGPGDITGRARSLKALIG